MLIDAGADLKKPGLLTPFLNSGNASNGEKLKFLLEHGVDPNIPDGIVKRDQTENFADSFFEVTGKWEEYPYPPIDRIQFPGWRKEWTDDYKKEVATALELTRLMLDAGAKAGPFLGGLLGQVAMIDEKGDVFRQLLAQRPDKVPLTAFPDMESWQAVPRQMYLDEALIPALNELPDITLVDRETGKRTTLAEGGEGKTLPTTLELLREKKDVFSAKGWPVLTLTRRGEEQGVQFDLDADGPLPELRAGDVLAVKWSKPVQNLSNESYRISLRYDWSIEKRISFPITLEIDDKPREILLRGDLLSFDPTKPEAPRIDAASLIALFLPGVAVREDSLVVKREGWNDVRLGSGEGFQLQKGDRLVVETMAKNISPKSSTQPLNLPPSLQSRVTMVSPGLPFSKAAIVNVENDIDANAVLPTLVQLITDAYAPKPNWEKIPREDWEVVPREDWEVVPRENDELFPWVAAKEKSFNQVPVVLPHPDFSAIRIRRTDEEGKESIVEVDLAEAIARCTDATTAEEARAADVPLKNGDVVELPILAEEKDKVWQGFSAAESRFFHKALAGQVLFNSGGGRVERRKINYQPPEWRISSHGTLPLPPIEGVARTRLRSFGVSVNHEVTIRREGSDPFNAEMDTFLRDGDQIDLKFQLFRTREPRPKVVPPPPASQ